MIRTAGKGTRSAAGAGPSLEAHQVAGFGLPLTVAALYERLRGGRDYVFCHASPAVDRLTYTALGLVVAAGVTAVVGACVTQGRETRPRAGALPLVFLVLIAALIVAADGVDAHGEREAARIAAQRSDGRSCDYTPRVYSATPGWFFW
ncbi:hypothetical protein ABZU86_03665 [Streptomyces sp. NPDC005271]|uniref:hypothetical protein n=1 Tax=unclassified Streptomyces TaxID=2593676 RepID=UPI0033AD687C